MNNTQKEHQIKVEFNSCDLQLLFNSYNQNRYLYNSFEKMVNIYAKDDFYKLHYVAQTYLEERKKQLK